MTQDNRMPNFWWCPTHHLYRGGEKRPCADAVRLVPTPPAPRVFLPHDRVPVGTVITGKGGSPFRVPDTYATDGLAGVGVPFVEVFVPSPEEWQALVDGATSERAIPEPPPPRAEPGEWVFRGYDQLGQDVWSWRAIPEPTEGQNRGE